MPNAFTMRTQLAALAVGLGMALAVTPVAPASGQAPRIENPLIITSFDGTQIVATMFMPVWASARTPVPVVLRTHGWGDRRETTATGLVSRLVANGYAVLTYDSRGFGESGGEVNVGSPEHEVRDASTIISYLALRPDILKDGPGDPRIGWTGGSNAGGIQLNTAAFDHRIDAIVPELSWGDLPRDLLPNDVSKQSWSYALYGKGLAGSAADGLMSQAGMQTGNLAQEIHTAFAQTNATGGIDQSLRGWFGHRSTTARSGFITTPTLLLQGTVDTLFPLENAFDNYANLFRRGTPVKLMTYCAVHSKQLGACPYPGDASGYPAGANGRPSIPEERIMAWLDRWVKRVPAAIGAPVEWQAQDGVYYQAGSYPLPGTRATRGITLTGGSLVGPGRTGGDGLVDGNPASFDELGTTALRGKIYGPVNRAVPMLGVPSVRLTGNLSGAGGFLFVELVDVAPNGTRVTVDDQVMPVRLGSGAFDRTIALHGVSWVLRPGHFLELEVTTGSAQYQLSRTGPYTVTLSAAPVLPLTFQEARPAPPNPPKVPAPPKPKPSPPPCEKDNRDKNKCKKKDEKKEDDDLLLFPRSM